MEVRIARPDELNSVLLIRRTVFTLEQKIPAELDDDGLDEKGVHVIALSDGEAVGCGRLVIVDNTVGWVARIAVRRDFRGKNIGRLIVQYIERVASGKGLQKLMLHPHDYLERFYADLGYALIPGSQHEVAGHVLVTMEKVI